MKITYVANEGFLIAAQSQKILVDALFSADLAPGYIEVPSPQLLNAMVRAEAPFDGIDLICATHCHWDHFDALAVIECLRRNQRAIFLSTAQTVAMLAQHLDQYDPLRERVVGLSPRINQCETLTINGITVRALRTRHSPYYERDALTGMTANRHEAVENLAFIYELEGERVFHSGDMDLLATTELDALGLDRERFSVALVDRIVASQQDGRATAGVLGKYINADKIVLMHIGPNEAKLSESLGGSEPLRRITSLRAPLDSLEA